MRIVAVCPLRGANGSGVALIAPTTGPVVSSAIVSMKLLEALPAPSR